MKLKLGDSELELLKFIAEREQCTVRDASDHFAEARGWGRTTVLKTIMRLMEKGCLTRIDRGGVFHYQSVMSLSELQRTLIEQFLTLSLDGSIQPLVAFLDGRTAVTDAELADLKDLVRRLEEKRNP